MVAVTPYTDSDAIRGCLGVTDNELLDEMVIAAQYDLELQLNLGEWLPDHSSIGAAADAASAAVNEAQLSLTSAREALTASESSLVDAGAVVTQATTALASAQAAYDTAAGNPPVDAAIEQTLLDAQNSLATAIAAQSAASQTVVDDSAAVDSATAALAAAKAASLAPTRSFGLLRLYSMWFCANLAMTTLQLSTPKKSSNGKDSFERFPIDMEVLAARVAERVSYFQDLVKTDQGIETDTDLGFALAAASVPNYDPITNEGF